MFRELFGFPGKLVKPVAETAATVADIPFGTEIARDVEDAVSPVTDVVGEVASDVGEIVGGVADEVLDLFGF